MQDENGIYITKKQASVTTALLMLLGLLIFIAGYFWGKHSLIEGFSQKASQESFNDQVDYLLTMQSFAAKHGSLPDETYEKQESESQEQDVVQMLKNLPDALEETGKAEHQEISSLPKDQSVAQQSIKTSNVVVGSWAALAGFSKKASAQAFINRLKKHKIDLDLKTKSSKSLSGKTTKTWYQVVTKKYSDREELMTIIDRIIAIEHIKRKDIKIF